MAYYTLKRYVSAGEGTEKQKKKKGEPRYENIVEYVLRRDGARGTTLKILGGAKNIASSTAVRERRRPIGLLRQNRPSLIKGTGGGGGIRRTGNWFKKGGGGNILHLGKRSGSRRIRSGRKKKKEILSKRGREEWCFLGRNKVLLC